MESLESKHTSRSMPYMQWFAGDWLNDPSVSLCSPATRGIWTDLLNAMHILDQRGVISGTSDQLARVARCSAVEFVQAIDELSTFRAADVSSRESKDCHGNVQRMYTLKNRRMSRAYEKRKKDAERKKNQRNRAKDETEKESSPKPSKGKAKQVRNKSANVSESCPKNVQDVSRDRYQRSDIRDQSLNPPLNAEAHEGAATAEGIDDDASAGSVVIPPCSLKEALFFAGMSGIPDDLATTWWEKHESEDWMPYPGKLQLTTKSWKFDLKNYADNRRKYEGRHRVNGAAPVRETGAHTSKSSNPRNAHVTDKERELRQHGFRIRDIIQDLRSLANSPQYAHLPEYQVNWDAPEYPEAIERLKNRSRAVFDKLVELSFIDGESGRPIERNGAAHSGVGDPVLQT